MAFNPFILQRTMNPEAVQSRFLNDDDRERFPSPRQRLLPEFRKARQQRADVPGRHACFDIFSPPPGDSDVISQVERLSSNETKIAPRSVRMALGVSGRSALTCMVVSRVGGSNLTLPERRSLSTSPWNSELSHTRENAETIALIGADDAERQRHYERLSQVALRWVAVIGRQARMLFLSSGNNVLAPAIPLMLGAPKYLAGEMSLGELMQAAAAFYRCNWRSTGSPTIRCVLRTGSPRRGGSPLLTSSSRTSTSLRSELRRR